MSAHLIVHLHDQSCHLLEPRCSGSCHRPVLILIFTLNGSRALKRFSSSSVTFKVIQSIKVRKEKETEKTRRVKVATTPPDETTLS